jgi:hypothetical protein
MKKTIAAGASLVAAALLVSSTGAATPKPKLPKRWRGTAVYTYTYQGDDSSVEQTVSASVVLVPVLRRGWTNMYEVSSGTITYDDTQKTSDGCTQTSSASFQASKYLLTLQLELSRRPRASFSGSEGAAPTPTTVTMTCPDGTTSQSQSGGVENPFYMLVRHTAGFPVNASLTKISGSLRTAQSGAVWTVRFSFVGKK